jgi:hypothetical protein
MPLILSERRHSGSSPKTHSNNNCKPFYYKGFLLALRPPDDLIRNHARSLFVARELH